MSRRQARELALQALFQLDLNPADKVENAGEAYEAAIQAAADELDGGIGTRDKEFVEDLVKGTMDNHGEIDAIVSSCAKDWSIDRMAGVDRNIARMAVYELKFRKEELTANIVINEAVELAKKYGTDDSSRFINGLLAAVLGK